MTVTNRPFRWLWATTFPKPWNIFFCYPILPNLPFPLLPLRQIGQVLCWRSASGVYFSLLEEIVTSLVWEINTRNPLWIKPTDALNSNFIGITTLHYLGQPICPSSGVLSRTTALVHFTYLWWPFATTSRMELQFHPARGSKWSSNLHKMCQCLCTAKNSWWWAERLPETCTVVIPIKIGVQCICWFHSQGICWGHFLNMQGLCKK